MRKFRDRDFIQTQEGFFFCVVGPYHPSDRVISYLKYVPDKLGVWGRRKRFERVMKTYTIPSLLETFGLLERNYPHYLFYSPFYNITMTAVPHEYLRKHYRPEEKLARLLQASRLDPLQKKLKRFVSLLTEISTVPPSFFGVTGSILLNIHRPEFSDIDLTVYGLKNSLAVKSAVTEAYSPSSFAVRCLEGDALKAWCETKALSHPLTVEEVSRIYRRKWNIGLFEDTPFSIHPVKLEQEAAEAYGEKIYSSIALVTIRAVVHDNTDAMFLPSVYRVQEAMVIEGPQVADIREVVSYEGLYSDLAKVGEFILARGKLERVLHKRTGQKHHRVLVGSPEGKGTEYVKPT